MVYFNMLNLSVFLSSFYSPVSAAFLNTVEMVKSSFSCTRVSVLFSDRTPFTTQGPHVYINFS